MDVQVQALQQLIVKAKRQGYISRKDFDQALPPFPISTDLIKGVKAMFDDLGIDLVDAEATST